jgi:hypothetical protein
MTDRFLLHCNIAWGEVSPSVKSVIPDCFVTRPSSALHHTWTLRNEYLSSSVETTSPSRMYAETSDVHADRSLRLYRLCKDVQADREVANVHEMPLGSI